MIDYILPYVVGHLGGFQLPAVVNNIVMKIHAQIPAGIPAFHPSGRISQNGTARSDANSNFFHFLRNRHTVSPSSRVILCSH